MAKALPLLPGDLRVLAEQIIDPGADLAPDPYGTTYGFFDGHGWGSLRP